MRKDIYVKGAREHNLKNIDLSIPRDKLVVFTGISGSGKSSLAFDTLFAEGQRRYVESLSAYARMFLGQMNKPDVDYIEGLSPAVAINQKSTSNNPRSTVGTITEIYDYLRLLYARIGTPYCPECGKEIIEQSVDQIADAIMGKGEGAKVIIHAPIARGKKGEYVKIFENLRKSGYLRVRVDGIDYMLDSDEIDLDKNIKHTISVIVDRLIIKDNIQRRLSDSLEAAIKLGKGLVYAEIDGEMNEYSTKYSCPDCDISFEELTPRMFSFNTPYGACHECTGIGYKSVIDENLVVRDWNKSINEGAIDLMGWNLETGKISQMWYTALAKKYDFSLDTPVKDLSRSALDVIFYGTKDKIEMTYDRYNFSGTYMSAYEGLINNLSRRYKETQSDYIKRDIERYMRTEPCETCHGARLNRTALSVKIGGKNIAVLSNMPVDAILEFLNNLELNERKRIISEQILKEIKARLQFLVNVGLTYLTLSRSADSLSGGEAQRIRLATQIGSGLQGVLYILDEPSIGLHQRDNRRLIDTLKKLRDLGNTLIVVEHDEETMMSADYIVDIGPGAGIYGGYVVAEGTPEEVAACKESITGQFLSGERKIDIPGERLKSDGRYLTIKGAKLHNLKNIDVKIPAGLMTVITGVSGSGKSSLINGILYPELARELNRASKRGEKFDSIEGMEYFDKVIDIDQSPIGRTPRSNPATYTGVFNLIRDLFAETQDARARGYKPGRFSFNVAGGRCENCGGDGIIKIDMQFLSDVYVTCEVCGGKRYNRETLEVKYKSKNISEVLDMSVEEACVFFENIPSIYNKLRTMYDAGLTYIKLGQPATTLSGGEAQRVKLSAELSKRSTGRTVYILDEPTTGLHSADVEKLIQILKRLSSGGNTVIVIEHNLDVIKVSDYIIDLGPEGGDEGGRIIAEGSPEEVADNPDSYTGQFLKKILNK
jgi:excinuclease ABC subunit A